MSSVAVGGRFVASGAGCAVATVGAGAADPCDDEAVVATLGCGVLGGAVLVAAAFWDEVGAAGVGDGAAGGLGAFAVTFDESSSRRFVDAGGGASSDFRVASAR